MKNELSLLIRAQTYFFFFNNSNSINTWKFSLDEIYSKLVVKFVDKTRIWGSWDTLYMCAYIWILLRGVDCSVILLTTIRSWYDARSAHFHIVLRCVREIGGLAVI